MRAKPLISSMIWKTILEFAKRAKVWNKKESAHDPQHMISSVKHGECNVMTWVCMLLAISAMDSVY